MRTFALAFFALSLLSFGVSAQATCTNPVTGVSMVAGNTTPVHVTVVDQNCSPISPANITETLYAAFSGIVTVSSDATGFNFSVPNVNQAAKGLAQGAQFTNTANSVQAILNFTITPGGVTSMSFTSP